MISVSIVLATSLVSAMSAAAAGTTLTPTADSFVSSGAVTRNYGGASRLRVNDSSPVKRSWLRFDVNLAEGETVESARLRLYKFAGSTEPRIAIRKSANTSWGESTITWGNQPAFDSVALATSGGVSGAYMEWTLPTTAVVDGPNTFVVDHSGSVASELAFGSREVRNVARRPELVVTMSASEPDPLPPPPAGGPFVAYQPGSFFNTPLPTSGVPVDSESSQGIAYVDANDPRDYPAIRGVGGNKWGTVYAAGDCADPVYKLTGTVPSAVAFLKTEGFHADAALADKLTGTSDSPFVVIDRCGVPTMPNGLSVWAAKASKVDATTINVGAAGAYQHDSNGLDQRNPLSNSTKNFRSRGAIPDAMAIRDDLLSNAVSSGGTLGHVLHMFWWETDTDAGHVHPMVGHESSKNGWGAEGIRIRVKEGVNLAQKTGCTPEGLAVARTLQRYGAYLGDNAGSGGTSLKAEQGSSLLTVDALDCLTWQDFEFVRRGWGG